MNQQILLDMDNTIADWQSAFDRELRELSEEAFAAGTPGVYNVTEGRENFMAEVDAVMNRRGFYHDLEPLDGAIEAVWQMLEEDVPVFICSRPWLPNPDCVQEKLTWLKRHFGKALDGRAVFTQDKTRVAGRILIDDIPEIHPGKMTPVWEHVFFTRNYNENIGGKRRLDSWDDWRTIVYA